MSMSENGGPAFPLVPVVEPDGGYGYSSPDMRGMSLRDWFAAQALSAFIAPNVENYERTAYLCYAYADAMLKERSGVR